MQSFTLRDGRKLAFDDVGDPAGYPVVWHHGSTTCRLLRHPDDSLAAAAALPLACVDRPGYGGSSPQTGRTLHGWADDVEQIADHLGLDRVMALPFRFLRFRWVLRLLLASAARQPSDAGRAASCAVGCCLGQSNVLGPGPATVGTDGADEAGSGATGQTVVAKQKGWA